jgi:hypothetical protein
MDVQRETAAAGWRAESVCTRVCCRDGAWGEVDGNERKASELDLLNSRHFWHLLNSIVS